MNENHARAVGLDPSLLKVLFFTLLAACTVAALQTVGAFLVIALVVTPAQPLICSPTISRVSLGSASRSAP